MIKTWDEQIRDLTRLRAIKRIRNLLIAAPECFELDEKVVDMIADEEAVTVGNRIKETIEELLEYGSDDINVANDRLMAESVESPDEQEQRETS